MDTPQPTQTKPPRPVVVDGQEAFAVDPITTCTHYTVEQLDQLRKLINEGQKSSFEKSCNDCENKEENWICLSCRQVECSRYKNGHMAEHFATNSHPVALSYADFSFWCYECDNYITSPDLQNTQRFLSFVRFGGDEAEEEAVKDLIKSLTDLKLSENGFTRTVFLKGLKEKKFKKIAILTGAGISVAAGIPDFRSPKSGLYAQLANMGLPYPEAVFEIGYFKKNPNAFYKFAGEFLQSMEVKPVGAHKFIKKLSDENQLLINLTQNIDGLELDAGLPPQKLLQCHGHMRTAKCIECKTSQEITKFKEAIKVQQVLRCEQCKSGLIKPDIVFFGESLPPEFQQNVQKMAETDLIIIMGTSLKVHPFAMLPQLAPKETPIVIFNMENVMPHRRNTLFFEGDIENSIKALVADLGWES